MQPQENKWLAVPQAIPPPEIRPDLEDVTAIVRSTECLRHFVLSTEFWMSPGGRLRHWLKINLCLGVCLLIPAALLMPVISLILHEVDGMVTVVTSIVLKLMLLTALVSVVVLAIKQFPSSSQSSSRRRK
jgi:hypothetical protein